MRSSCLPCLIFLLRLTLALLYVSPIFGQTPPPITNLTKSANPASSFPNMAPGNAAVIVGTNLADSTASAAPSQTLLGGVEVHLAGIGSDVLAVVVESRRA